MARLLSALGAFFVVALAVAACGDSVPSDAVATVDGEEISRKEFNHWFGIAAATNQARGAERVRYNPPDFAACVASKRKTAPKPAKGQPSLSDAQLKTQCKQEYEGLRDQVMQFLVLEKWISGEAEDQGIRLSAAEANREFEMAKKQSFPKESDFNEFLKQSGMTIDDAKFQVRFNTLYTKLREKAVKGASKVTPPAIVDFYNENKKRFATPAMRDLRVILTKSEERANAAKRALQDGQSWRTVARRYSIDQASKNEGGSLLGVAKGSQERTFDTAIFNAKRGELTGPIKTQFGYYVFQVQKITPAKQQSLKEATPAIRQQLNAQNQQKADDEFNESLRKKWKARTNCADAFVMAQCKNAPKPKTSTTAVPGQQQPQPQQPPASG